MKKIAKAVLVFVVAVIAFVPLSITIDRYYFNKNLEKLRLAENYLYQMGYKQGVKSTMHEFIEWIPAYKVVLPENSNYSTFVLERRDEAVPILFVEGSGASTISNCIITAGVDVRNSEGIRFNNNLDGSGNDPKTVNLN